MAAAPNLPDFDTLALERVQLQRRLSDLERQQERLQERLAAFPNEVTARDERRVASELDAVNDRIDTIDATLIPHRLTQSQADAPTDR
jgi:predicted RNase H-like nuclease (RuvC/YqgF family)